MRNLTALILAGGRGERLRPMTDEIPKCMVPVRGKPIIGRLIEYLFTQGVQAQIVCTGYKSGLVKDFVSQYHDVTTSYAGEDVSMGKRIGEANASAPLLICYGDTLADISLQALEQFADHHSAQAVVTVHEGYSPFGEVIIENGKVQLLTEKPRLPHPINIGFILAKQQALNFMVDGSLTEWMDEQLIKRRILYAYQHYGHHLTVNDQAQLEQAEKAEWLDTL